METGNFYFLKNDFYTRFNDCGLMGNKDIETIDEHGRPCYYCFNHDSLLWMVPISSKVEKYRKYYAINSKRYKDYDNIQFGFVNGEERAFLIQNCFPTKPEYIDKIYTIEKGKTVVTINQDRKLVAGINRAVRKVIRLYENGLNITFTDLDKLLAGLSKK